MPFDAAPERKARRPQAKLTDLNVNQVKTLKTAGRHRVSKRLCLNISPGGARSWVHQYMHHGKAHELWLGSADTMTLAQARDKVIDARRLIAAGKCPIAERRIVAPVPHPFSEVASLFFDKLDAEISNEKYKRSSRASVATHIEPHIGKFDVADITTSQVHDALSPIWITINPTASLIRCHLEGVFGYARGKGWRSAPNPAVWKECLDAVLPAIKLTEEQIQDNRHPSIHFSEIGEFMTVLRGITGDVRLVLRDRLRNGKPVSDTRIVKPLTFRALETVILSGLRSGEASGARWPEIDLDAGFWTVPARRMKARKTHVVALSPALIALFRALPRDGELLFGKLGINDVRNALRAVEQVAGKTWRDRDTGEVADVHGMRSSFGTWAGDRGYDTVMIDVALGHIVLSDVGRRYMRGDMAHLRTPMMSEWADHCGA
jgi:integrase